MAEDDGLTLRFRESTKSTSQCIRIVNTSRTVRCWSLGRRVGCALAPPASAATLAQEVELESRDVRFSIGSPLDAAPFQVAPQKRLLGEVLCLGHVAAEQNASAHQGAPPRSGVVTELGVVVHH